MTEGTGLTGFGFVFEYEGRFFAFPIVSVDELRKVGGVILPDVAETELGIVWEKTAELKIKEIVNFTTSGVVPPTWFEMIRVVEVPAAGS